MCASPIARQSCIWYHVRMLGVRVHNRPWALSAAASLLLAALFITPSAIGLDQQLDRKEQLTEDVQARQEAVAELEGRLEDYHDKDYVMRQARDRLGYVKDGERLYRITDQSGRTTGLGSKPKRVQ